MFMTRAHPAARPRGAAGRSRVRAVRRAHAALLVTAEMSSRTARLIELAVPVTVT
jgi:hypothetical protein